MKIKIKRNPFINFPQKQLNEKNRIINLSQLNLCEELKPISSYIIKNTNLTELDLYYNKIDSDSVKYLLNSIKGKTTLKSLNFGFNNLGTDGTKTFFGNYQEKNLTYLYIGGNKIKEQGVELLLFFF